ncbi:unnamed protein product [Adineta steineri]|uniref:Uncharacterized protein n=1 Tax=Adineta steineri TaxID=433720 RepID=A0A813MJ09_9BILA|nr:unnamed protein product [Adineta steineri]
MSKTLVYQTNKEFDKCAELLRSIINAQESRRDSSSPNIHKDNRKEKQKTSTTNTRLKKQNSKINVTKTSFIKTNDTNTFDTHEHRLSYSPNKIFYPIKEEVSPSKNRLSPTKSRKHITRSPSPPQTNHQRLTSSSLINNKSRQKTSHHHHQNENKEEFIRSSSCSDLSSLKSDFMQKEQTRLVFDRFLTYLTRIQTISKQIRIQNFNDSESHYLWHELENSLSSAISYAKNDIQFQLSLAPLRNEILELRKQLQTANVHLHEYDLTQRHKDQYIYLQKKFDTNQIQYTELLLHNEQLKNKCHLLQDKLDNLERNNIHLVQRLTQQDIRSIAQRTEWNLTDNRFLLREEIIFLKEKLYHVYDDVATLFNRNHFLESDLREEKKQIFIYEQQFKNLKQTAQYLLYDLDNRSFEEKIKQFLNNILNDKYHERINTSSYHHHQAHMTPTRSVDSSSLFFETPHKSTQPTTYRREKKFRPKSLFITPTILNDSKILSKFRDHRSPTIDITQCSSSTIDDADSTLTSSSSESLHYQQRKRNTLYNSLPLLNQPPNIDMTRFNQMYNNNNESSPEFDEISNLTSKIFSSENDDDIPIRDINISTTSSSTMTSDAEKLISM